MVAQDPAGADFTIKVVKEAIKNGGSAILLDSHEDMKQYASQYISLEWNNQSPPPKIVIKLM